MTYGRVIWLATILTGVFYAIGYASFDIREIMSDGVPMSPAIVGIGILFCLGATVGSTLAIAFAPRAYFDSPSGQSELQWDRATQPVVTRVKALLTAAFGLIVTGVVLYLAFVEN